MAPAVIFSAVWVTFEAIDTTHSGTSPIDVPGVRAGDIVLATTRGPGFDVFEPVITVNDQVQQQGSLNRAGWPFGMLLFRPLS